MPIETCARHEWMLRAIELAESGAWAEEACARCGDERVVPPTYARPWTDTVEAFANQR